MSVFEQYWWSTAINRLLLAMMKPRFFAGRLRMRERLQPRLPILYLMSISTSQRGPSERQILCCFSGEYHHSPPKISEMPPIVLIEAFRCLICREVLSVDFLLLVLHRWEIINPGGGVLLVWIPRFHSFQCSSWGSYHVCIVYPWNRQMLDSRLLILFAHSKSDSTQKTHRLF